MLQNIAVFILEGAFASEHRSSNMLDVIINEPMGYHARGLYANASDGQDLAGFTFFEHPR